MQERDARKATKMSSLPSLSRLSLHPKLYFTTSTPFLQLDYHDVVSGAIAPASSTTSGGGSSDSNKKARKDSSNGDIKTLKDSIQDLLNEVKTAANVNILTAMNDLSRDSNYITIYFPKGIQEQMQDVVVGVTAWNAIENSFKMIKYYPTNASEELLAASSIQKSNYYQFFNIGSDVDTLNAVQGALTEWASNRDQSRQTSRSIQLQLRTKDWSIAIEYDTHCTWLRTIYAPTGLFSELENIKPMALEEEERALITQSFDRVIEWLREKWRSSEIKPSMRVPYDMTRDEFLTMWSEDQSELLNLSNRDLTQARFASSSASTFGSEGDTKLFELFRMWLNHMYSERGSVYMSSVGIDNSLSLEHIVPLSWLSMCSIVRQFRYAGDDPVMMSLSEKTVNSSRANKALGFVRNPPSDKTWVLPRVCKSRGFLSRTTIYAFMTYPLISESGEAVNMRHESPSPNGSYSYSEQLDESNGILESAQRPVEDWEMDLNVMTYLLFHVVNPLAMSRQTRQLFARNKYNNVYKELLRRRLDGTDHTTSELLIQLRRLTTSR